MNLLILGATGSIGRHLVPQAIDKGHQVTALVRDPANLPATYPQLRVLGGDALNSRDVDDAVRFQDAVIYAIGADQMGKPTTLFSDSTRILLEAMTRQGVRRLVAITGIGAGDSKGHGGFFYDQIIYRFFTKPIYEDKDRQEELIRSSDLDWTIVRPASFTDRSQPGAKLRVFTDLRGVTVKSISRADTAAFVLEQVTSDRWLRQAPLVGY